MRFVVDTNLLVSGVLSAGLPRRLVDGAMAGELELCTSEALLAELRDMLSQLAGQPIVTARQAIEWLEAHRTS